MKGFSLAAVCGLCCVSMTAMAQADPGAKPSSKFYVGVDVGSSTFDSSVSQQFFGPGIGRESGSDMGYKVRFGIQISRYFGVEAAYTDFGSFSTSDVPYTCAPQSTPPCTYNLVSETRGPSVGFVGTWPFAEHWGLNARIGGFYANMSTTERDPDVPSTARSYHESGLALQYGLGLSYRLNPRMTLSLDWGQADVIAFGPTLSGGAGVYDYGSSRLRSLGFAYRF